MQWGTWCSWLSGLNGSSMHHAAESSSSHELPLALNVLKAMPHHITRPLCMLLAAGGAKHAIPLGCRTHRLTVVAKAHANAPEDEA